MSVDYKKIFDTIKKPSLSFFLENKTFGESSIRSYVGGIPYSEKHDRIPTCHICKQPMEFVFQFHQPKLPNGEESSLYSFYYCYGCESSNGNKGFRIKKYDNPSLEKMKPKEELESLISYAEFRFSLSWSIPDWDTLSITNPDVYQAFVKQYKKDAGIHYENSKEDYLDSLDYDSFSFFGGYPSFLSFPEIPKCDDCHKRMDLWLQLDSLDDIGLSWSDNGCLYVFKCPDKKDNFKILIQ